MKLVDELARLRPDLDDPHEAIAAGRVLVGGRVITNPASLVRKGSSIAVRPPSRLRGEAKLRAAIEAFDVAVRGKVALDVGAAAGGFTKALLDEGALRVYAVDAGHGQLLGSLRQDPRVVNLEATNVADLDRRSIPETVDIVTIDVSYLSLSAAVAQLGRLDTAPAAILLGLVKPMFELRLPRPPADEASLNEALDRAIDGVRDAGWTVRDSLRSAVTGSRGAVEFFVFAVKEGE